MDNTMEVELNSLIGVIDNMREDNILAARHTEGDLKSFHRGISVVVPVYRSVDTILETLESLRDQTLDKSLFEAVLVLNGPDDGAKSLISQFMDLHPELNIRLFENLAKGASTARNLGLALHRREYVTFVDADDLIQENFLASSFELASRDTVVLNPIFDLIDGAVDRDTVLNNRIEDSARLSAPSRNLADIPWVLGFNACKLVPSHLLQDVLYDESLQSGEDLVFFANLLSYEELKIAVVQDGGREAYLRRVVEGSVSRQAESFDFNVAQRLECIMRLSEIDVPQENRVSIRALIDAQLGFIQRYTETRPSEIDKLEELVAEKKFLEFPWERFNKGKARDLVISYCFSPYSDSSATVAEKAVSERRRVVDVISNEMSSVRRVDPSLKFLSSRWVENRYVIDTPSSFAGSVPISQFASQAVEVVNQARSQGREYRTMYSRALWAGSHVAAALVKNRIPDLVWSAEFSDPLRYGADGSPRKADIIETREVRELSSILTSSGFDSFEIRSFFDLVEAVTLYLADEIIFTNENQRDYMLRDYSKEFAKSVEARSVVRPHPSPVPAAYNVVESEFVPAIGRANLGYFGSFYANRGLEEIFVGLANLQEDERSAVKLHIFCNTVGKAREEVSLRGLADVVSVDGYLPYMEFLNATTKFDVLIVNDVSRAAGFDINPFLPSKFSDIRTSGAKVWGLVDEGSPLSQQPLDYRSAVGDQVGALKILQKIIADKA